MGSILFLITSSLELPRCILIYYFMEILKVDFLNYLNLGFRHGLLFFILNHFSNY